MKLLDSSGKPYRTIAHAAAGVTETASRLRGHRLEDAAKSIIVRAGITRKAGRYLLTVVSGDRQVDLERVRELTNARDVGFARKDIAEGLAGSVSGSFVPFSLHPDLELIVDRGLLEREEIYFNAARLDRSVALASADYLAIARPLVADIACRPKNSTSAEFTSSGRSRFP
ncbi:YbaK/EbsC family protein [Actinomadura macrotermitis]|uniref:YbaK/aminoacyl-tRNA synthetase-associated domain-containing protein n=1 Tax=Actinomadura macrotermitis TaxID=2585200 RepID=A0A7K0BPB1_9ACTN|nr:YbaK/EbsC family protein [Actinomadura macrotermitis]MQY03015.1 hypothetical protein [Actinomadura macrotermitis]